MVGASVPDHSTIPCREMKTQTSSMRGRRNKAQSVSLPWIQSMGWLQWHEDGDVKKEKDIKHEWNLRCLALFIHHYTKKKNAYQPYQPAEYKQQFDMYKLETPKQKKNALQEAKSTLGEFCNNEEYKLVFQRMGINDSMINEWQS